MSSSRSCDVELTSTPIIIPSPPVQAVAVSSLQTRKSRTVSCTLDAMPQIAASASAMSSNLLLRKRRFSSTCNVDIVNSPSVIAPSPVQVRNGRMSSSCSSDTMSQDESSSNTLPSCPSTPVQPGDVNTPPSFKFLKTKKVSNKIKSVAFVLYLLCFTYSWPAFSTIFQKIRY